MKRNFFTDAAISVVTFSVLVGCSTVPDASQSAPGITTAPTSSPSVTTAQSPVASPSLNPAFESGLVFAEDNGVAIRGTDPVAYFTENRPVPGSSEFTHAWMGATWYFSSAANRDRFAANPEQYAPQYGGYCAFAVANNYTASTVPEAWSIVDGKLYLNFSLNVRDRWERDIPGNIAKANTNWPHALNDFR